MTVWTNAGNGSTSRRPSETERWTTTRTVRRTGRSGWRGHVTNPLDRFEIENMEGSPAGLVLHWQSVSNRLYSVYSTSNSLPWAWFTNLYPQPGDGSPEELHQYRPGAAHALLPSRCRTQRALGSTPRPGLAARQRGPAFAGSPGRGERPTSNIQHRTSKSREDQTS